MANIVLRGVSVDFPIYQGGSRSLKKTLVSASTRGNLGRDDRDRVNVRALDNITLDLNDGDRLAIIGPNGAGKSTLLKVLAGIFEPTNGRMLSFGRVAALLDIAVGFNPEATGRENVILRGMYMGVHPTEMRKYVGEITEFTELGHYIDMPVRTYSSGMNVRLAFAISTCIAPEILVMDEWLSAGDASFLAKARHRMEKFARAASIMIIASHSFSLISEWCNRGLLLDKGHAIMLGSVGDAISAYRRLHGPFEAESKPTETTIVEAVGSER